MSKVVEGSQILIASPNEGAQETSGNNQRDLAGHQNLENHLRFQALVLDQINDAVIAIDDRQRITYFNPAAERQYGIALAQALGRPLNEVYEYSWAKPEEAAAANEAIVRDGFWRGENIHIRRDGVKLYVESAVSVLKDEAGRRIALLAVIRDVTERRRTEESLRQSDDRYRAFIEQSSEGIWRCELEQPMPLSLTPEEQIEHFYRHGYLAECNDVMARMYGYERASEIAGARLGDLLPREDAANLDYLRAFIASGHRLTEAESHEVDRHGQPCYFRNNLIGIVEGDRLVRVWGTQLDITERKRAKAALEESRVEIDRQRRLIDLTLSNIGDNIGLLDREKRVVYGNRAAEKVWGLSSDKYVGLTMSELDYPPEVVEILDSHLDQVFVTKEPIGGEIPYLTRDGATGFREYLLSPVIEADGNVELIVGISRDITERKRNEESLRLALGAAKLGTWQLDLANMELSASKQCKANFGRREDEPFTYEMLRAAIHPEDLKMVEQKVAQAVKQFTDYEAEYRCLWPDGSTHWIQARGSVLGGKNVQAIQMVGVTQDITARKRSEMEIERRYSDGVKLTETNRMLLGALEFDQMTEVICRAACELTGADGATFVLREKDRVRYAAENAIAPLWKDQDFPIECCISGWSMLNGEAAVIEDIYADERIPGEAYRATFVKSLAMVPVGLGVPVASIGVYWASNYRASAYEVELLQSLASAADLALASVRAYDETRRARTQAENANRLKDEFLATLSHELRNPLNSIVGYSEVLLRSPEATNSSLVAQAGSAINRNARTQAHLINDLLDLSRLQTGKFKMDLMPLSFASVVADAVESVQMEAAQKEIHLDLDFANEPLAVYGDAVRLQQIVWNLVNNAVKFTPQGGRVSVALGRAGQMAKLVVEDTGQGIDPEFLPHAFEMFRQADARTTRRHGGLGIGLALVKQLTELHEGQVAAYSDGPGRGARFTLTIPLHAEPQIERPAIIAKTKDQLAGAYILIVDDTPDSLAMLDALLSGEGARVETATNGKEALKLTAGAQYDLIISDISMPEMDGYEFLQKLRASRPNYLKVPAIALTGFGREEDAEKARRVGFTTHLTKPLDFDHLLQLARVTLLK